MAEKRSIGSNNAPGLTVRSTLSSVRFFNALCKYIPSLVLSNWTDREIEKERVLRKLKQLEKLKTQQSSKSMGFESASDEDSNQVWLDKLSNGMIDPEEINRKIKELETQKLLWNQMPYFQEMETVVLFADISGFTAVSEACSGMGIRGNEELSFVINRYMEGMVKNLSKFGGDIIKFVGDAMIVMWPRQIRQSQIDEDQADDEEKVLIIRKAIQCALDIQKDMHNKKITANVTSLKVKIGIGWGKCALLYVGGVFNRSEFFTVGIGLERALESEGHATEGGQIIVNESAWRHVKDHYYDGVPTKTSNKFYLVTGSIKGVKGGADAILMKNQMKMERIAGIQQTLRSCVPAAITPYLEIGFESYGSETRTLTVMFASLGVEFQDTSTPIGRNKIQKILTVVQQQVYRMGGSLNKLMMDDKGCTLVCIWGASPMAHIDDPARAILCALNMRRALNEIEETWCNVGIATGEVFSGVVGTSGSRKEFSCLGDTANLAARIMCVPKKKGIKGGILCEIRTKNEAMNQISFNYYNHAEFKGKSVGYSIYEPVDPYEEFPCSFLQDLKTPNKIIQPQCLLKLGFNPLIVQREVNHRKYEDQFEKKVPLVDQIFDQIKSFFLNSSSSQDPNHSLLNIIIHGQNGSGKTQIVRSLCKRLQSDQELTQQQQINIMSLNKTTNMNQAELLKQATSGSVRLPIFASTPNSESRMKFLGSWRPILRSMFEFRRRQLDMKVADLLRTIIQRDYDKLEIIMEVFGFAPFSRYVSSEEYKQQRTNFYKLQKEILEDKNDVEQITQTMKYDDPLWFVKNEKFSNSTTDSVLDLCAFFIKDFLGEVSYDSVSRSDSESKLTDEVSVDLSQGTSSKVHARTNTNNKKSFGQSHMDKSHTTNYLREMMAKQFCILIFDNAHMLEEESWTLILRLYANCQNICIVMSVNQSFRGTPIMPILRKQRQKQQLNKQRKIDPEDLPYFNEEQPHEKPFMKEAKIYDIPSLNSKGLQELLVEIAPLYQETNFEENKLRTAYNGPTPDVPKTPQICREWMNKLTQQYNLSRVFTSVDDKLCNLLIQRCDGNITVCLQYFLELILNGHIQINERNKVIMKKSLERCQLLQNFTKIPVPSTIHKWRLRDIDEYLLKRNDKEHARKKEIYTKGIIVLKAAAVIGEEFGTAALKHILPLREETNASLNLILKELEQNDLVETLDETDPKNIHFRFNKSFLRESIYQVMLYKDQKQYLHSQLAEYIQSLPTSVLDADSAEIELLKLKDHVMIGEDITDYKNLPLKQKQGIIVKEMQIKLVRNNKKTILHKDCVYKQGKGANKKISKRFMIMSARELMWFHNIEEFNSGATALGVIKMINIYKCSETLMMQGSYDFDIGVTAYIKKGQPDNGPRVINFGCQYESERHEWITRIEFLRAMTVYENYVNKFVNIQFPLKQVDDVEDDSQQKNEQLFEKLNHFAKTFRQNVQVNATSTLHRPQRSILQQKSLMTMRGSSRALARQSIMHNPLVSQITLSTEEHTSDYLSQNKTVSVPELAEKVLNLYRSSIVAFHVQTTAHANKVQYNSIKNKPIGQIPDYFEFDQNQKTHGKNESILITSGDQNLSKNEEPFSPQINEPYRKNNRSRSPLLKYSLSENTKQVSTDPLRIDDRLQAQQQSDNIIKKIGSNDATPNTAGGEIKKNEMEIVQEQEEGRENSSSTESKDIQYLSQTAEGRGNNIRRSKRGQTPESVVPVIGVANNELKKAVGINMKPRNSQIIPKNLNQQYYFEQLAASRGEEFGSTRQIVNQNNRSNEQFQNSKFGNQSNDSDQMVTAMLEKIDIDKKGSSSQKSWQKPLLQVNQNKDLFNKRTEISLNRTDRGFTIHDIERTMPSHMNQHERGIGQPKHMQMNNQFNQQKNQIYNQMLNNGANMDMNINQQTANGQTQNNVINREYPLQKTNLRIRQNLSEMPMLENVSSIKDDVQPHSNNDAEIGYMLEKDSIRDEYAQIGSGVRNQELSHYNHYNPNQFQQKKTPHETNSIQQQFQNLNQNDNNNQLRQPNRTRNMHLPKNSGTTGQLVANYDDMMSQYPKNIKETINQQVQRQVNKSLQRFFTQLNEQFEKSGMQSQSAKSSGRMIPSGHHDGAPPGGINTPPTLYVQGHTTPTVRGGAGDLSSMALTRHQPQAISNDGSFRNNNHLQTIGAVTPHQGRLTGTNYFGVNTQHSSQRLDHRFEEQVSNISPKYIQSIQQQRQGHTPRSQLIGSQYTPNHQANNSNLVTLSNGYSHLSQSVSVAQMEQKNNNYYPKGPQGYLYNPNYYQDPHLSQGNLYQKQHGLGMLKNKVLSERSLMSKQTENDADDDDEGWDPKDDEVLRLSRAQQPMQAQYSKQ